jgi:transposase-like protein
MAAESGNLGGKKEAAALLLAVGRSVRAVAREAGCSERTLRNWQGEEAFAARVRVLRSEVFARSVGILCGASARAAAKLRRLLRSEDERIGLGAARAILEATPRLREAGELAERVAELEKRLGDKS